jgi:hypothetical protein
VQRKDHRNSVRSWRKVRSPISQATKRQDLSALRAHKPSARRLVDYDKSNCVESDPGQNSNLRRAGFSALAIAGSGEKRPD